MYFGTLCVGADCAGGLLAMELLNRSDKRVDLVFKSVSRSFVKLAKGDVHFVCEDGERISALVEQAITSSERVESPPVIKAYTHLPDPLEVATFELVLSLKCRDSDSVA